MPHVPLPDPAVTFADIVARYTAGTSINALAKALRLPYGRIRRVLVSEGVTLRSRQEAYRTGVRPTAKLTPDARAQLVAELHQGEKRHLQLAQEYGITRQRIRQIATMVCAPSGREVQKRIMERRVAERKRVAKLQHDACVQRREAKYRVWRDLWASGATLAVMAATLHLSPSALGVRITELRRKHPDWFPYRRAPSPLPRSTSP